MNIKIKDNIDLEITTSLKTALGKYFTDKAEVTITEAVAMESAREYHEYIDSYVYTVHRTVGVQHNNNFLVVQYVDTCYE